MNSSAFEFGEKLNNSKVVYFLHKPLWDRFNSPIFNLKFDNWTKIKYLNDQGNDFNASVDSIPRDIGGLYLFYVKCEILSGITEYPFYLGRAQYTGGQNLKKRVKEYFQHFSRNDERPKIFRMFKYWASDLHLAYFPLADNVDVVNLEKDLINSLLLPMNDQIPDTIIKDAIKAFE